MSNFKVGDRVEYTGDMSWNLKGKKGTISSVDSHDVRVDWDDGSKPEGVFSSNITLFTAPIEVGDRVEYVGGDPCGHNERMIGKTGIVSKMLDMGDVRVDWDDNGTFSPYINNLKKIDQKDSDKMNDFQEKVYDHLFNGGDDRREAMRDLIAKGFFNPDHEEDNSKRIAEVYVTENPRRFCDGGIRRFREATGLKPPRKAMHLMSYGTTGAYHTVCGLTHNTADAIFHAGQGHHYGNDKPLMCPDCREHLDMVIDLNG